LALLHGEIDAGRAFEAATVDEAWNLARWGRDAEAVARLELLRAELGAVARYFAALRDD
jgi:chaperone required for assembly of F1-ATPase